MTDKAKAPSAKPTPEPARPEGPPPAAAPITALAKPLVDMTLPELERYCTGAPQEAARAIQALLRLNTAEMPDTVMVRRDQSGVIRQVRSRVTLRESEGNIVTFRANGKRVAAVTAAGYRRLNQVCQLQIIAPDTVVVGGTKQPNPYVQCNARTGRPEVVYCRKLAIGPGPSGSLVATDVMLRFDLSLYLLENILAKVKKAEGGADRFGRFGMRGGKPEASVEGLWTFIPMSSLSPNESDDMGLWINLEAGEIKGALAENNSRMKFAERVAQTIAERNALKAHPCMPAAVSGPEGDGPSIAVVPVVGWIQEGSLEDIQRMRALINDGDLHGAVTVTKVEVETDKLDEADRAAVDAEVVEQDAQEGRREADPDAPKPKKEDLLPKALEVYRGKVEELGLKGAKSWLKEFGVEGELSEQDAETLAKLIDDADESFVA